MKHVNSKKIDNLYEIELDVFRDFRGEYVETYSVEKYLFQDATGNKLNFLEDDISYSKKNVLRGLHGDSKTWKLIQCLYGEIFFAVVDLRRESKTYKNVQTFLLSASMRKQILVPAGCANGHLVLSEDAIFSYKQSEIYSGMNNQFTLRWDHPDFKIEWPVENPILSQRDSTADFLKF
jgi:dTDP-4-dehydrorhamnose 3,5-epimerase